MKNKFLIISLFTSLTALLGGCGNDSGYSFNSNGACIQNTDGQVVNSSYCYQNNTVGTNGTNNGYYMQNQTCYSNTGQPVAITYCSNNGVNNGYNQGYNQGSYFNNGYCYSASGQILNAGTCTNTTTGTGTGYGIPQQCVGTYYRNYGSGPQPFSCNGANCSGQTLQDAQGNQVLCQ